MRIMAKTKVFVSFDYDNDKDIKGHLVSQAKRPDSPFSINDFSIKFAVPNIKRWQREARDRIIEADIMIVLCGSKTHESNGVAAEVTIAQETKTPYYLLKGRRKKKVFKPRNTKKDDQIIPWRWEILAEIIKTGQ